MEKYFEKNNLSDRILRHLYDELFDDVRLMSGNLVMVLAGDRIKDDFMERHGEEMNKNLAASALHMIAVCEAALAKLPDSAVDAAMSDVRTLVEREHDVSDLVMAIIGSGRL